MERIALAEKLDRIHAHWQPHVVAELNGQLVKLVKVSGEFVWHHHDAEDELFHVLSGHLRMEIRDGAGERAIELEPGEMIVIPRGVEHRPVAPVETAILLFEPATTLNTGNLRNERTVENLARI